MDSSGIFLSTGTTRYPDDRSPGKIHTFGTCMWPEPDPHTQKKMCSFQEGRTANRSEYPGAVHLIVLSLHCFNAVIATGGSVVFSEKAMEHLKKEGVVVYMKISFLRKWFGGSIISRHGALSWLRARVFLICTTRESRAHPGKISPPSNPCNSAQHF
jgi:hypothetical protein